MWLRGWDLNPRPPGYEPDELPNCSTPRRAPFSGDKRYNTLFRFICQVFFCIFHRRSANPSLIRFFRPRLRKAEAFRSLGQIIKPAFSAVLNDFSRCFSCFHSFCSSVFLSGCSLPRPVLSGRFLRPSFSSAGASRLLSEFSSSASVVLSGWSSISSSLSA